MSFEEPRRDALLEEHGELLPEPGRIGRTDAALRLLSQRCEADLRAEEPPVPRPAFVVDRIAALVADPDVSMRRLIAQVRLDPVLCGRIVDLANSTAYRGSQPIFSLEMALVRLGLNRIREVATILVPPDPDGAEPDRARSTVLESQWRASVATALACEALARSVAEVKSGSAYLTGLFHAAGEPLIVNAIGRLERAGKLEPQSRARVLGLVERLRVRVTGQLVSRWSAPRAVQDAIRLQDRRVLDRRARPLAHLLAAAKALVAELGIVRRPVPIDFSECRDFEFLGTRDTKTVDALRAELAASVRDLP